MADLSFAELQILRHSLGFDEEGRGSAYRNHYCTGPGAAAYRLCMKLVSEGVMVRYRPSALSGGDDIFMVTPVGRAVVDQHAPPPEKISRSARRYRQFLDEDSGMRFGDWLRMRGSAHV